MDVFVLDPLGAIETLNSDINSVFNAGLWEGADQDVSLRSKISTCQSENIDSSHFC